MRVHGRGRVAPPDGAGTGRVVVPEQSGPVTPPSGRPRHAAPDERGHAAPDEPGRGAPARADPAARVDLPAQRVPDAPPDFAAVHRSPEFADVRRRRRRFVLPVTVGFLLWYLLFVVLSAFVPGLMAVPVLGVINLGMVLGLLQFASTLAIVAAYLRYARTHLDPRVKALRSRHEGAAHDGAGPAAPAADAGIR